MATKRLAVGETVDLQQMTRRLAWRDFKLTKDYLVTPDGLQLVPGSLRHVAKLHELVKADRLAVGDLTLRLWKLETALSLAGIRYRDFADRAASLVP